MNSYEEKIKRLEVIVQQLESGEPSLEDSLKLFEEGVSLSKSCNELLDEADQKIQKLVEKNTELLIKPLADSED